MPKLSPGYILGGSLTFSTKYFCKYDKIIIVGDFNIYVKDKSNPNFDKFCDFCDAFTLSNLVKDGTCLQKLTNQAST